MKYNTKNPIIEAALRSIADALPIITAEAEAEQKENAEHVKFIDRLEGKIDELAKELWLCEQKAESDTACLAFENDRLKKRMSEMDDLLKEEIEVWEDTIQGHLDYIKELERNLDVVGEEFTIIVDETDAYWRKKDLRRCAHIEYLNALLANNEDSMRHEEALEENAARDDNYGLVCRSH